MDPDATLALLRGIVADVQRARDDEDKLVSGLPDGLLEEVCELFSSLDYWLRKGGYLPKGWTR